MGFSTKEIQNMKNENFSYEEIQELSKRVSEFDSGNMKCIEKNQFWNEVHTDMNRVIKQYHNA